MAKLMLIGEAAQVEITRDDEGDQVIATCVDHKGRWIADACDWTETYDDMGNATEYAADHADGETR